MTRALGAVSAEPPRLLDGAARDVADQLAEVGRSARMGLETAEREIGRALTLAEAVDPGTVLAAGYAILRNGDGAPLSAASLVAAAPIVRAEMRDGAVLLRPDGPAFKTTGTSPAGGPRQETTTS